MNAFKYGCSVDGENFCARPDLSKSLSTYVESGQNLVIQGERRIGKTSLVKETVSSMRGWSMLYADFMGVKSVTDVCNRVADALARFDSSDSFMRRIFAALVHLRPVATVDAMTGLPTISVDARASAAPSSVNTVMNAVEAHVKGRKACVVFDEFQDILDVKDGEQMLALMRGRIQFMPHTSFVFLGSARNAMMDIFMSPKSPFYKSAAVFDVGTIPDDDFFEFAKARFATGRRRLPRALFGRILDSSTGHRETSRRCATRSGRFPSRATGWTTVTSSADLDSCSTARAACTHCSSSRLRTSSFACFGPLPSRAASIRFLGRFWKRRG